MSNFTQNQSPEPYHPINYSNQINQTQSLTKQKPSQQYSNQTTNLKCMKHQIQANHQNLFVCLEKKCSFAHNQKQGQHINKVSLESRMICVQCIDEQVHKGHTICSISKLNKIMDCYQRQCQEVISVILSKIEQLKYRFDRQINDFTQKTKQIFSFPSTYSSNQQENAEETRKLERVTLQQLKHVVRSPNITESVKSMLKFQEESISEQIQNIYNSIEDSIRDGMANVQFINHYHHLTFNPDDMHADSIGLTLDRNKLQVIDAGKQGLSKDKSEKQICFKIAFTQCRLFSENSVSFRVNSIKNTIMLGCVDKVSHQQIGEDREYQNCQELLYGVAVNSTGEITLYNKGLPPSKIQGIQIKPNDVIELTFHQRQNTVVVIKYSVINETGNDTEFNAMKLEKNSSIMANMNRTVIATISIEPSDEHFCYPFAAVCAEGDCVSIVESITLQSNQIDQKARKIDDSFEKQKEEMEGGCAQISNPININQKINAFKQKQKLKKTQL